VQYKIVVARSLYKDDGCAEIDRGFHVNRPLPTLPGFGELVLTGDIDAVMINHLKQPLALRPFVEDMVRCVNMFQSRAETYYRSNNLTAAYFYWHHMQYYWNYHSNLAYISKDRTNLQRAGSTLKKAVNATSMNVRLSLFGVVKIFLRLGNYEQVADITSSNRVRDFYYNPPGPPILRAKFEFCYALSLVAQGRCEDAKTHIKLGAQALRAGSGLYREKRYEDISDEVRKAIDNELIQGGSPWRCGRNDKVDVKSKGGSDWQLLVGSISFWDLLEISEEIPTPDELSLEDPLEHFQEFCWYT
jgi:hypothetical protein